jgi:hypothetical protein
LLTSFIKFTTLQPSEVATSSVRPKENTLGSWRPQGRIRRRTFLEKNLCFGGQNLSIRHSVAPFLGSQQRVCSWRHNFIDATVSARLNARMNSLPMIYSSGGGFHDLEQN